MMRGRIRAIHYCLPGDSLTNESLALRFGEKQIASVSKMSGIQSRCIAPQGITAADLALTAANRMLDALVEERSTIDGLIFASQTPDYQIPPSSSVLHSKLGLPKECFTLDISIGCPAFPYASSVADSLLSSGKCSKVLVLMGDTVSHLVHPDDRSLASLHGDGAAAMLLESTDKEHGFMGFTSGIESAGWEHIVVPAGGARLPCSPETCADREIEPGVTRSSEHLAMNGPAVFQFSISEIPSAIDKAIRAFGVTMDEVDLIILHQANQTMLELIYKRMKVPPEKQFFFMESVGNLAAASTPVALAEAIRQEKVKPNSRTLIVSFGNGLNWGIALHQWGDQIETLHDLPVNYEG